MLSQLTFCCQVNTFLRGGGFHGSININAVMSRTGSASNNINAEKPLTETSSIDDQH